MQVCLNGHQITAFYDTSPENRKDYCSDCGAKTIAACQACGAPIKGYHYMQNVLYVGETTVPNHCHSCGAAYPWATTKSPSLTSAPSTGPTITEPTRAPAAQPKPRGEATHPAQTPREPDRLSREGAFVLKLLLVLGGTLVAIVVGSFFLYVAMGFSSVATYEPPIGQVMAFVYNVAEVGGVACGAIFGLIVVLHQVPRLRRRIDELLGGSTSK